MQSTRKILLTIVFLGAAIGSAGAQERSAIIEEENVTYAKVNGVDLRLDIYRPALESTDKRPAVILIHGGGWSSFDKGIMRPMAEFLARSQYVAFSVDYRLFKGTENTWPAQLDDVQTAVRWIRANASKYGVDAKKIGALGHSSGGQLAALLGMLETRDNSDPLLAKYSSKVQAVVDISGPSDFTVERDAERDAFMTRFLGGDYRSAPQIWRAASPVFHVDKKNSPFLIVHGTRDQNVPLSQAQELYQRLHAAGVHVKLVTVDDVHTFQTAEANREMGLETIAFLNRYMPVMRPEAGPDVNSMPRRRR